MTSVPWDASSLRITLVTGTPPLRTNRCPWFGNNVHAKQLAPLSRSSVPRPSHEPLPVRVVQEDLSPPYPAEDQMTQRSWRVDP